MIHAYIEYICNALVNKQDIHDYLSKVIHTFITHLRLANVRTPNPKKMC